MPLVGPSKYRPCFTLLTNSFFYLFLAPESNYFQDCARVFFHSTCLKSETKIGVAIDIKKGKKYDTGINGIKALIFT
jgi:hypothetical protein